MAFSEFTTNTQTRACTCIAATVHGVNTLCQWAIQITHARHPPPATRPATRQSFRKSNQALSVPTMLERTLSVNSLSQAQRAFSLQRTQSARASCLPHCTLYSTHKLSVTFLISTGALVGETHLSNMNSHFSILKIIFIHSSQDE